VRINSNLILNPTDAGARMFRVKGELELILHAIKEWRKSGIDGNGVVPIEILPLEARLESSLNEVDAMINLISQIKSPRRKKK